MKNAFFTLLSLCLFGFGSINAADAQHSAASAAAAPRPAIRVVAAGSLTGAMTAVIDAYQRATGQTVHARFGPSGVLREEIEEGAAVDIFASANMTHPQSLATNGRATPPIVMLRNRLCARARPGWGLTADNLLERMLDPAVGIGTSTPVRDPGGDYAWQVFARAETVKAGAKELLEAKAQQIFASKTPPQVPAGQNVVDYFFAQNRIHMTLGYCSRRTTTPDPNYVSVALPPSLAVSADYGLSVILHDNASREAVYRFALYLMSASAQAIMAEYGFMPVTALP